MNEKLTIDEFEKLLDAYAGALSHLAWARSNSTITVHSLAAKAVCEARNAIMKAVFP